MSNSLKLLITFRKCLFDPVYVKTYTDSFFNQFKKNFEDETSDYNIVLNEPTNIDIDNVYKADLYEMEVTLQCHVPEAQERLFSKIIQEWCNPKVNKLSNLWLRIADPSLLKNSGKLLHSDVEIKGIAFGTLPDMQHFMQHYHYDSVADEKEIMSTFLHSQRKLMIFTCFLHSKTCAQKTPIHNKFQFNYHSISQVIINYVPNTDFVQVFFHLRFTPFIYVKKAPRRQKGEEKRSVSFLESDQEYQMQTWERTLDFGCSCKRSLCSIERIGKCPVLKIVIPKKNKTYSIIERLIHRCPSTTLFHFTSIETVFPKFQKILEDFEKFPFNENELSLISNQYLVDDIKFKLQFAWEVLNSRSLEVKDQISLKYGYNPKFDHWEKLKEKLKSFFNVRMEPFSHFEFCEMINKITDNLSNTLFDISEMINKNLMFTFSDALEKLFDHHLKSVKDEEIPDGMCLVRRIVITPSKLICLPPTEHFDNRVIRYYGPEYLLRVSIQDDNFQKLTYAVQYNSKKGEFLSRVVGCILLEGIFIGPRHYQILAASNSQLREHGLWMYARDEEGNTADSIRKWMGDFNHIKNVAKYMARMGQCFSTSEESVQVKLKKEEVINLPDITLEINDKEYIFSDGVGMISKNLAEEVRKALAQRDNMETVTDLYDPSAFQIRFKGCKGMLAESRTLNGRKIAIRPSMEKFPCKSSSVLEIVKISAPRAVFLNRPLITILENLGVEASVFLELQKKMVFDLTDSLIYERKARKMLENSTSLDFPFKKLTKSGISLTQEPFFRSLLLSVYRSMIGNLKRKARIAIPPKYGRNMLGVIDETRTLEYGQIFAQYSEQVGNMLSPTKILTGTVVVTKNPCMHPGDVRKLEAVDVPALHHIKDCVVFPAKGKRPHPDEMAGSDLDGDEYVLIWYPKLIFPSDNSDAMDYPANEEIILDRPIEVEDMIDFLCTYIQNDNIGLMANAYLAWADYNVEGIFSEVCQKIAHKYPQALDFAKSGTTQYLESSERPKHYPDFMEKGCQNNSYKSDKTLGLLYRVIRNLEASVSNINSNVHVIPDAKLEYFGWGVFESLAKYRRDQYSRRIKNILIKYGLQNEAEALTGFISEVSDCNKNKYDADNVASLSKKYIFHTMKKYHYHFFKDCEEESAKHPEISKKEVKYRMASAWYMVTYQDREATILSFPWIVSDILCELRDQDDKREKKRKTSESVFIENFDKLLLEELRFQLRLDENVCDCVSLLNHTILDWVQRSSFILTMSAEDVFCMECFNRIVSNFRQTKMFCCSSNHNSCYCAYSCSPMKMILECFKYYASEVIPNIGTCSNIFRAGAACEGFRDFNLQSLALKTYAVIAITQSMHYLGLMESNINDTDSNANEEGDPIRVRVTEEFENILTGNVDRVCRILKELSGVKQVHIDGSSERSHFYMIVQSIGKAFNRWNLEELIMDSKCPYIIQSRLNNIDII